MARTRGSNFFCSFLLAIFTVSSCATGLSSQQDCKYDQLKSKELEIHKDLLQFFFPEETIHDKIEPPVIQPSPQTFQHPNTPSPNPLITVTPNKTNVPGVNPSATPVPVPNTNITNSLPPPSLPSTNPVTQPVLPPPTTSNLPHNPGQTWCVAKSGAPQAALQAALDYACGVGGVGCSVMQQGGSCYSPVTLENHASYAFNSFYQRNPVPTSCDFGGTAMITNSNPSYRSCIFPTSSTSTSSVPPPVTKTPTQTPPTSSVVPTLPPISTPPAAPTLPLVPTPPASPTPPALPTPPAFPTPPASPTPPTIPTPPASPTPPAFPASPAFPTPPASMRPPALPTPPVSSPGTAVPSISGSPVLANSTNNTKSGFPMGGFPNIFPTVSTSMPPAIAPSVTSNSKQSALAEPFISSFIMLAFIGTWNHI